MTCYKTGTEQVFHFNTQALSRISNLTNSTVKKRLSSHGQKTVKYRFHSSGTEPGSCWASFPFITYRSSFSWITNEFVRYLTTRVAILHSKTEFGRNCKHNMRADRKFSLQARAPQHDKKYFCSYIAISWDKWQRPLYLELSEKSPSSYYRKR